MSVITLDNAMHNAMIVKKNQVFQEVAIKGCLYVAGRIQPNPLITEDNTWNAVPGYFELRYDEYIPSMNNLTEDVDGDYWVHRFMDLPDLRDYEGAVIVIRLLLPYSGDPENDMTLRGKSLS